MLQVKCLGGNSAYVSQKIVFGGLEQAFLQSFVVLGALNLGGGNASPAGVQSSPSRWSDFA